MVDETQVTFNFLSHIGAVSTQAQEAAIYLFIFKAMFLGH